MNLTRMIYRKRSSSFINEENCKFLFTQNDIQRIAQSLGRQRIDSIFPRIIFLFIHYMAASSALRVLRMYLSMVQLLFVRVYFYEFFISLCYRVCLLVERLVTMSLRNIEFSRPFLVYFRPYKFFIK